MWSLTTDAICHRTWWRDSSCKLVEPWSGQMSGGRRGSVPVHERLSETATRTGFAPRTRSSHLLESQPCVQCKRKQSALLKIMSIAYDRKQCTKMKMLHLLIGTSHCRVPNHRTHAYRSRQTCWVNFVLDNMGFKKKKKKNLTSHGGSGFLAYFN